MNNTLHPHLLAAERSGRSYISTEELAFILDLAPQTLRKRHCQHGHYFGIRPRKLKNRFLHWPIAEIKSLLEGY